MKTRFMSNALICGICYNEIKVQGIMSSCKHEFCFDCIAKWSDIENKCPVCKIRFIMITSEHKRKVYKTQTRKKNVNYISDKSQKCNINLLALIETAEQLLTHELYRLLDSP